MLQTKFPEYKYNATLVIFTFARKMSWWFVVLCCLSNFILGTVGQCSFNLDTPLGSVTPIILRNGDVIEPNNTNGDVFLQQQSTIQFLCSGRRNHVIDPKFGQLANGTCVNNNQFMINSDPSQIYGFGSIKCKDLPKSTTKDVGTCNLGAKKIEIGFEVTPTTFLPKIELCFNPRDLITYWTANLLRTSPYSCQISIRTNFKTDYFGNVNPDQIYSKHKAYEKGHLTPLCDFFSGSEKRMTCYYINASPQFAGFNKGNWKSLENEIRNATSKSGKLVYIYTGTTQTVGHLDNVLPVQQFFWKVVVESVSGDGIAFVGVNDVQQSVNSPCLTIPCSNLLWLSNNFIANVGVVNKGQISCCTVQNFSQIQKTELPTFTHFRGGVLTDL